MNTRIHAKKKEQRNNTVLNILISKNIVFEFLFLGPDLGWAGPRPPTNRGPPTKHLKRKGKEGEDGRDCPPF